MLRFYKRKKNIGQVCCSWPSIFILLVVVFFLTKSVFNIYQEKDRSSEKRTQSELVYDELKETEDSILTEIESLKTEKGIEIELRDKFRVVKEGEQMAVIINSGEEIDSNIKYIVNENIFQKFFNFIQEKF